MMSETITKKPATKIAAIAKTTKTAVETHVLAVTSKTLRDTLDEMSLLEVAEKYGLDVNQVKTTSIQRKDGSEIPTIALQINGKWNHVPFSRTFNQENFDNPDVLLGCKFYKRFAFVRDENGDIVPGADGKEQIDEMRPTLSFGNPSGLTVGDMENIWDEPNADDASGS